MDDDDKVVPFAAPTPPNKPTADNRPVGVEELLNVLVSSVQKFSANAESLVSIARGHAALLEENTAAVGRVLTAVSLLGPLLTSEADLMSKILARLPPLD